MRMQAADILGLSGKTMTEKRRREWQLEDVDGNMLASGVLYDEGNVQVLWRSDLGYTAEQYASVCQLLGLMPEVAWLRVKRENQNE